MSVLCELKGQNGKIFLHEDRLVFSRDTLGGFLSQGGSSGERLFYLKDISGIEYKKPTFWANGYIKVLVHGTAEVSGTVGILGSSTASMKDHNTLVLRAFSKGKTHEADEVYELVMKQFSKAKNATEGDASSRVGELTKLAELYKSGILSEEEFQREKAKLLDR